MAAGVAEQGDPFARLLSALPVAGTSDNADEQTRAVLFPLIERAARLGCAGAFTTIPPDPSTCPNCGGPAKSERSPYCSRICRETAAFVRQFRSSIADGSIFDEERQMNLGQKLWSLQGGGFPRRQLMVPAKTVAKVIARDGGVCTVCGAPATEIDHVGSG
ncbi:MAG: hypothetical protein ACHQ50_02255 [Fimbriimonadales bacterium]